MKGIAFNNVNTDFSVALRKAVDEYFKSNNLRFTGNSRLYGKTAFLLSTAVGLYTWLVFFTPTAWLALILCVMMGLTLASIGFNVMHDGAHGSYSHKKWINEMMAYSLNLMGGSSFFWKLKHNVNHHNFTNIEGHDDDIDIEPWIRTNSNQQRNWYHRYQHFYWVILYGFTYHTWVFSNDFQKYFTRKVANTPIKKISIKEHIIFWASKVFYVSLFLVLPVMRVGFWETALGYGILSIVCGFVISVVFQLAHVVEDAAFPMPDSETQKVAQDWTVHQLATTANFSTKSRFISWFVGGLNFQVEHHLFPRISHIHYPQVSKLVREVCDKFNIHYIEYPTLYKALKSHVLYLKAVGVN